MRRALIAGLDYYDTRPKLSHATADAQRVADILLHHGDGTQNFATSVLSGKDEAHRISARELKIALLDLFTKDCETALFYYSGYGYFRQTEGYLITSDCMRDDDGLSLHDVFAIANKSKAKNKIIILDVRHNGPVIESCQDAEKVFHEGVTLLWNDQIYDASETTSRFTKLVVEGLQGAAVANEWGEITPSKVYAYMDSVLEAQEKRPLFYTNTKTLVSLRRIQTNQNSTSEHPSTHTKIAKQERLDSPSNLQHFERSNLVNLEQYQYFEPKKPKKEERFFQMMKSYWYLWISGKN